MAFQYLSTAYHSFQQGGSGFNVTKAMILMHLRNERDAQTMMQSRLKLAIVYKSAFFISKVLFVSNVGLQMLYLVTLSVSDSG